VVGVGLAGEWFVGRDDLDWCGGFPVSEAGEVEGWGRRGFFVDDCQRAGGGHSGYCNGIFDLFFRLFCRARLMGLSDYYAKAEMVDEWIKIPVAV
jgi:hypothetical protein